MIDVVVTLELGPVSCVRLPGWTVLGVAALLTAPRLFRDYLDRTEG